MRVVITGAAGQIGSQIVEELSAAHELCLIDRRPLAGRHSIIADLAKPQATEIRKQWFGRKNSPWTTAFEKSDVVIHLAANAKTSALWREVLRNNIEATWNVLEAAARYRVPRVVFASSNWAVKALERELAPACYTADGPKIGSDTPPRPITPYGMSKAFGETIGRKAVDEGQLHSFVAVRIGSYLPVPPAKRDRRPLWIGSQDIRGLLRGCVEGVFGGFHVVYGVSAQPTSPYDLSYTRRLLSWEPRQNAMNG